MGCPNMLNERDHCSSDPTIAPLEKGSVTQTGNYNFNIIIFQIVFLRFLLFYINFKRSVSDFFTLLKLLTET